MRARQKQYAIKLACLSAMGIAVGLLLPVHDSGNDLSDQQARAMEVERVHDADLPALYAELNREYYGDQLPDDVSVSWSALVANKDCSSCAGMTDWDTGFPRIRLDPAGVRTDKFLRQAMEHEMCHVATVDAATKAHEDFHGPLFQACMLRYAAPTAPTTTD